MYQDLPSKMYLPVALTTPAALAPALRRCGSIASLARLYPADGRSPDEGTDDDHVHAQTHGIVFLHLYQAEPAAYRPFGNGTPARTATR